MQPPSFYTVFQTTFYVMVSVVIIEIAVAIFIAIAWVSLASAFGGH